MARTAPVRMYYQIQFETAIRGHHIYKDAWLPRIGQRLICKKDDRNEALEYDVNAIGLYRTEGEKPLVGHIPIELSCLLTNFLQANPDNVIEAEVSGKRKREVGLIVPAKYTAYTKVKSNASILCEKLCEKKARLSNFELVHTPQDIVNKAYKF